MKTQTNEQDNNNSHQKSFALPSLDGRREFLSKLGLAGAGGAASVIALAGTANA
jgi:hypothetical protein